DAGRADGLFGAKTETALRAFQRDYGLSPDGTFGPATMRALRQLGRRVVGGRPQFLREAAAVAVSGPNLLGKRVVIDPGHGGPDRGMRVGGISEADVVWDLATHVEGRLAAFGVTVYLTHGPATCPSDLERAQFGNATGADLLLSLHLGAHHSPAGNGVATYHFGSGASAAATSTIGERLAGLVHREVVARTGLLDCRTHGKTWELLRMTRMPAVLLEPGYLTHPGDRTRLTDPSFREVIAEAVLVAVQRLFLPAEVDPPTGTYVMPAAASAGR
ncbi:MAG TPA: N-acetylmuramoyl-L-alanine amidase, partial [Mycobacteriales bacterium]|nr:N-acetylmuramoyl-L-alanine amidase [Mycobacteriales bacterium]